MSDAFIEIFSGLRDAISHAKGKKSNIRVLWPRSGKINVIRKRKGRTETK